MAQDKNAQQIREAATTQPSEKRGAVTDAVVQVVGSGVGGAVGAAVTAKLTGKK